MAASLTAAKTVTGPESRAKAKAGRAAATDREARFRAAQRAAIRIKQASDPTRLQVLLMLADGEKYVGALCEQLSQTQPAVSHHLALLRHGGMIEPRRAGKNNFYRLTEGGQRLATVVVGMMEQ